jgi:transglutaminase-like putative cysteine protease
MSRREFRVTVDMPRPLGAILMVGAASATLAVSGHIAFWVLGLQALAIVGALFLRSQPRKWQRSAPILNLGLLAACLAGILHYGDGEPATIALAHFAMLAQGLQLLDARPRRSEYLLVALALFQVVLASNLTDSILFPGLLVVFLLATVWTLIVHTLALEALEAGESTSAQRVATPALLRTTVFASMGCILIALVLFLVLPRMRSSLVHAAASTSSVAVSGFSDRVELGDIGRIRSDYARALRVETVRGEAPPSDAAYWRGLAFDHFDGWAWSVSSAPRERVSGLGYRRLELDPRSPRADLVQRIVREPTDMGVLFGLGAPRGLEGLRSQVERDANGNLYAPRSSGARVDYTLRSRRVEIDRSALVGDTATPPAVDAPERFVALPRLSDQVRALALEITANAESDGQRAAALEGHLRRTGRYTDTPPRLEPGDLRSPVEVFLFEGLAGHCEYFATGMAVLARSIGLPTRLVTGFAGGRANALGGFVELAHADAHAWVEVHFERAGWVRFDATPLNLRLRSELAHSMAEQLLDVASAIEYWYFDRIVDFDRNDQIRSLTAGWRAWRRFRAQTARERDATSGSTWREALGNISGRGAAATLAAMSVAVLVLTLRHRRRPGRARASGPYFDALRLLSARRKLVRPPARTPRAFAREVRCALPADAADAFSELTESYLAARYGGGAGSAANAQLRRLRQGLRAR